VENSIVNTCGELEREVKSRTYNIIEAFVMMTICLFVLWFIIYPFGELMEIGSAQFAGCILLGFGAVYILFASPFIHKDTLSSWGLGNPVALYKNIRERSVTGRILFIGLLFLIIAILTFIYCFEWEEASRFIFGLNREAAIRIKSTTAGKMGIFLSGMTMATLFSMCVVRYDNFLSALFTALKIILVLGSLEYIAAFIVMGKTAFADFQPQNDSGFLYSMDLFSG